MSGNHHIIERQSLHVTLKGDEGKAWELHNQLLNFCNTWLTPKLADLLDAHAPQDAHWVIERMEIDVGTLAADRLEDNLPAAVIQAIERWLQDSRHRIHPVPQNDPAQEQTGAIQYKTEPQVALEVLVYFARTGRLPWSFRLPEGQNLEQFLLSSWKQTTPLADADLLAALATVDAAKRFSLQFSTTFLGTLLTYLAPAVNEIVHKLLQTLVSYPLPAEVAKTLQSQIWQTAFMHAKQPSALADTQMIRDIWQALPADCKHQPALLDWLTRHWPEALSDDQQQPGESRQSPLTITAASEFDIAHSIETSSAPKSVVTSAATDAPYETVSSFVQAQSTGPSGNADANQSSPAPKIKPGARVEISTSAMTSAAADAAPDETAGSLAQAPFPNLFVNANAEQSASAPQTKPGAPVETSTPVMTSTAAVAAPDETADLLAQAQSPSLFGNANAKQPSSTPQIKPGASVKILTSAMASTAAGAAPDEIAGSLAKTQSPNLFGNADAEQSASASEIKPDASAGISNVMATENIYINNAGLVLLHPFLPQFFRALNIVVDDKLIAPDRALSLLHFLGTGQLVAPEYELVLPKVLLNLALETPVDTNTPLTAEETGEATALLEAVIRHWAALKGTSDDGLRGTFLIRPGKISLRNDGDWRLQVENKAYDILLDQLPWGIGMIKLPWMHRMLWVEWRY
ncbi:MAG: contractile injection system tape measure protein [Methylomicrobium sp.]